MIRVGSPLSQSIIKAAGIISVGKDFRMGRNVKIYSRGDVVIGDYCRFGDNVEISVQDLKIGDHFFHHEPGLRIGGGGSHSIFARIEIGDRCVMHNNYINVSVPVKIGSDVGLSPNVCLISHGFWLSPLEGFPLDNGPIEIGDGVIVGFGSTILPGVSIAREVVVGATSTVSRSLERPKSIYAGVPAKFIREIEQPNLERRVEIAMDIMKSYLGSSAFTLTYPKIFCKNAVVDLEEKTINGTEDSETDDLRDFLRRNGIRIYTSRPFGLAPI